MANFKESSVLYRLSCLTDTEKMDYNNSSKWKRMIDNNKTYWNMVFDSLSKLHNDSGFSHLANYCHGRQLPKNVTFYNLIATATWRKEYIADVLEYVRKKDKSRWHYFPEIFNKGTRVEKEIKRPLSEVWKAYNKLKHNSIKIDPELFNTPFGFSDNRNSGLLAIAFLLIYMLENGTEIGKGNYSNPWIEVRESVFKEIGKADPPCKTVKEELTKQRYFDAVQDKIEKWLRGEM